MKTKKLYIILIILILLLILLTIVVLSNKKLKEHKNNNNKQQEETVNKISYWTSYKYESYDDNKQLYEEEKEKNLIVKIEKDIITLCTDDPEKCETAEYKKVDKEYITTGNNKIKDSNLSFLDAYDKEYGQIIQVIKYHTDDKEKSHTIFYFKNSNVQ